MPKSPDKKRFEVHLLPEAYRQFEKLALEEGRSVKNYMERILLKYLEDKKKNK